MIAVDHIHLLGTRALYHPWSMRYFYDPKTDWYTIEVSPGQLHRTLQAGNMCLDFDQHGWLLNIRVDRPDPAFLTVMRAVSKNLPASQPVIG